MRGIFIGFGMLGCALFLMRVLFGGGPFNFPGILN